MSLLDQYERRARLTPGLLALAPITLTILTLGLKAYPVIAGLGGLLVAIGGPLLLANMVGYLGREAQKSLYKRWDGTPSTKLLRKRESTTSDTQRTVWRDALASATGIQLLPRDAERKNPEQADETIEAAIGQVLYLGHDGDGSVRIVVVENAQYGFERNIYGLRWLGRGISVLCFLVVFTLAISQQQLGANVWLSLAVIALFIVGWCLIPSERRVKEAGFRYARQLLNAVTNLNRNRSS
jgi:hypothetical protein